MLKHLKYARYVLIHKWYVFLECARRGLLWRGIVHDWHKMLPSEWFPYAEYFYGEERPGKLWLEERFDFAWLLHQKRADHHWQWWICPQDDGGDKLFPMSPAARTEMLCDWLGASKAQGYGGNIAATRGWYEKNKDKMRLHPQTRAWIEQQLCP